MANMHVIMKTHVDQKTVLTVNLFVKVMDVNGKIVLHVRYHAKTVYST